jgi:thiol-disulfide isomerase/thioredoxin
MIRGKGKYFGSAILLLAGLAAILYVTNPAPGVPGVILADMAGSPKPFVIKVHAQWCPVCMMTRSVWNQVQSAYTGRVNLVVFDVTSDSRTETSRLEARRLGLETFFDEYSYSTGTVYVLDGRTKAPLTTIHGSRNFADYSTAIDSALMPLH